MRARLRLAVTVAALLIPATAASEPTGSYFYAIPFGGYTLFDGTLRMPTTTLQDAYYVGGRLGYRRWPWLGAELAGGFTPTKEDLSSGGDVSFWHATGDLVVTPWEGWYGGPFVLAGFGRSQLKPKSGDALSQGNLDVGGGLQFWITDAFGLRLEARDQMWIDNDDSTKDLVRTHTLTFGAGVSFAFGGEPRDSDHDGVGDRQDACPDTPSGASVDLRGCPGDEDQDTVLNGIDQCPNTLKGATVDAKGCPSDGDGDGVFDGLDDCADTPKGATVNPKGCPSDGDGDGVLDGLDRCPDTPKGATVNAQGCPSDADGDGVFDGLDRCPDTSPGLKVDKEGCPIELLERETELLDTGMIRLTDVNFETAKAELLPESKPAIDVVGQLLRKWPELQIEVGGHTDARGDNKYNQRLSEARAKAVLEYLITTFPDLNPAQFTAKGYGELKPISDNKTPEGMARNRRVEFVVMNKDVLRKESTKRRFLREGDTPADTTKSGGVPGSIPVTPPVVPPGTAPADTTGR